jgi:hypothetical protein
MGGKIMYRLQKYSSFVDGCTAQVVNVGSELPRAAEFLGHTSWAQHLAWLPCARHAAVV